MSSLDDPLVFPGSICTIVTGSAVEQPEEVTLIQDGGMIPCDAKTIVPLEDHGIVIQDVVNVPNLFPESGTSDDNVMSLDDGQKSIPTTVGDDDVEYMVTDLARAKPRKTIVGGAPIFPTGTTLLSIILTAAFCFSLVSACLPLTEGQLFVPMFRTANQIPSCQEVSYFCPRLSGGSIPRQTNGRKSHRWRDVNHALGSDRQTIRLGTILREGHDSFLFSGLVCAAGGRPRSAEPQHYSGVACPERCGNRIFSGGREQSKTKIVFMLANRRNDFRQSMERPPEITTEFRRFGMVHGDNGRIQPISRSLYSTEIGDR
ncbi:MAG: hypothetical protein GY696_16350, partial [Gammaproteobacteria bacterium]|nr:hypothetical protein [Gammaproteobacteria bacterium]